MATVPPPNNRELRKFGLVMAGACIVLGLLRWTLRGADPVWFFAVAGLFLLTGLLTPRLLRRVYGVWMKFGEALNWLVTRAVLTLVFYGMITPARLLNQVFGSDPLKRAWDPKAESYWEEPEEQPAEFERYKNQF